MKILVTGAQGQVGQEIVEAGNASPHELRAFSKAELDICNAARLDQIIQAECPQLLINAAAYTAVDQAEQDVALAYAINRDAVQNLAQVCKRYDLPLIHLSTDYVFDGEKSTAYTEEDVCSPLNVYGASKAAGEILLQREWEKHLIVRTSWVFGKQGPNFVKTVLRLALQQKELRIVSDQKGCPTAAADLAAMLLKLAERIQGGRLQPGIFHYRGDLETNWHAFADKIIEQGRSYFPLKVETLSAISSLEYKRPAKRPKNSVLDMRKIKQAYGIDPASCEEALPSVLRSIHQKGELREYLST